MREYDTITKLLETVQTIAVVGFSSRPSRAGYYVPEYMQKKGYRIIPVNPYLTEETALGEHVYPELSAIPDPVDLVLLFRLSELVPPYVNEAIAIGAKAVWMQLGIMHEEAATKARAAGLDVVMNACMLVEYRQRYG